MTATGRTAALVFVLIAAAGTSAGAHSGLRFASPLDGSTLGASPTHVQLTFVERPEPSLATIRVSDVNGQTYQIGQPEPLSGDPLTLTIAVRELPRGVYIVNWRVVSAVDGHATTGAFAFGVQTDPTGAAAAAAPETTASALEIAGRSVFLLGLIVMVGAAIYPLLRLGEAPWTRFAGGAILLSTAGLAMLIAAQVQASNAAMAALMGTPIGRAWILRAGAIVAAAAGVAIAAGTKRFALTQLGAGVAALAAGGAIAAHAFAGHAAAGRLPVASTVIVQAIHVAAVGAWIGGLVMVVAGLRGPTDGARAGGLARFSTLATIGLVLVTVTGVARSLHEVEKWEALTTTTYGALVLTKVVLLLAIAALGATNRWRHLGTAMHNTNPLRRTALGEIGLAAIATVIAGTLATLPPPAATTVLPGIEVEGTDFATTVKARLTAVSDQPGPNRFNVKLTDYDSGDAISPDRVTLRFTPIDDPGVASTSLALTRESETAFGGTGANITFDGRWRVNVVIERGAGSVDVPLEIEARGARQELSVLRVPGRPPVYSIDLKSLATIEIVPSRDGPGQQELQISCYGPTTEPLPVREMVVTAEINGLPIQTLVITRRNRHQFTTMTSLERGTNRIQVIARTETGDRLRARFELKIPGGG